MPAFRMGACLLKTPYAGPRGFDRRFIRCDQQIEIVLDAALGKLQGDSR